jgi:hypothetical protein
MDNISRQWFGNCTRSIQAWITFEAAPFQKCIIQGFGKKIYHGSVYFHQTGGKIIAGMVFSRNCFHLLQENAMEQETWSIK